MSTNIKSFLLENETKMEEVRLINLRNANAPQFMITTQEEKVKEFKMGKFEVGGNRKLLNEEFESFEVKKINGGKQYIEFDNGIKYFPSTQFGKYITK